MFTQAARLVDLTLQARNGEQWIKQGKDPIKWTQLSRRTFAANPMRPDDVFAIYTDSLQPSAPTIGEDEST